jgi:colicin import membrane protein
MNKLYATILIAACAVYSPARAQNDSKTAVQATEEQQTQAQRELIDAQRGQVQRSFTQDEAACYQKFAVNDCINGLRARRREALADLRRQELELNNAERRRKGAAQMQSIDDKANQASEREAAVQEPQRPASAISLPKPANPRAAKTVRSPSAPTASTTAASQKQREREAAARQAKAQAAADREASYAAKLQRLQADRDAAAKRAAQGSKPAASGLPTPP